MTAKLTLPIVIGKRYVRRDGVIVTIKPKFSGLIDGCVYAGESETAVSRNSEHVWTHTGRVSNLRVHNPCDLVADHVEQGVSHPHAALMLEYAQDAMKTAEPWKLWQEKPGEHRDPSASGWYDLDENPEWASHTEYRRKPKPIRIGNVDVPEPLRKEPAEGSHVWAVALGHTDGALLYTFNKAVPYFWAMFHQGMLHDNPDAARKHCDALIAFTIQS